MQMIQTYQKRDDFEGRPEDLKTKFRELEVSHFFIDLRTVGELHIEAVRSQGRKVAPVPSTCTPNLPTRECAPFLGTVVL